MSDDISSKVKKIVADHLGIDEAKVNEESSFIDDLGADSLDTVELVMAFEEEFGSEISDSDAEKILTRDLTSFVATATLVIASLICKAQLHRLDSVLLQATNEHKHVFGY